MNSHIVVGENAAFSQIPAIGRPYSYFTNATPSPLILLHTFWMMSYSTYVFIPLLYYNDFRPYVFLYPLMNFYVAKPRSV